MNDDKVLRPLKDIERYFVKDIVNNGLTPAESYSKNFGIEMTPDNGDLLKRKAQMYLKRANIRSYYDGLMEDVRDYETKKAVWTKEVATEKLMKVIERAENDLYNDEKPITMSRLNAILQPIKELNLMNGLNQTNVNVDAAQLVQFVGEDNIPD